MLKPSQHDPSEEGPVSLLSSMHAMKFLYEESFANGNDNITLILEEALICGDSLAAEGREISCKSREGLLYLFFLKAILGLHPKKIAHLVALLRWLEMIPRETETGKPPVCENNPKPKGAGKS